MSFKRSRDVFEEDSLQSSHSPFVFYGTPLPAADRQSRDDGSYVPVWKQEVTDERGRKRLHGAFTGGFSAGYFNTVGSKEGWTPSTYISSRLDRAKDRKQPVQQRPEDFMDEEDLREAEEARKLHTTDEFAGFGSTATDPNRKAGLMDIFRVSGETMGVKLLKRMGWKEGQGVGPKVRRRANLHDGVDDSGQTYLFAPENSPMISFDRKDDYKGIGFQGESRLQYSSRSKREIRSDDEDGGAGTFSGPNLSLSKMAANKKHKFPKRGGFGVGILNDTGSDEEDPYEMGPQLAYNRVLVDDRKSKESRPAIRSSNPLLDKKPVFISKKAAAEKAKPGFRKCYDGRFPIDGFLLGNRMSALSLSTDANKYAPPEVPADWKSSKLQSVTSDVAGYISVAEAAKSSTLDPKSRAAILGEAQLPGKGWMPYSEDESKRDRYRAFLEIQAGLTDNFPPKCPGASTDDWLNELNEFARAAEVFKPMSGLMASRFTSSTSSTLSPSNGADPSGPLLRKTEKKPEDPAEAAAKLGMYGPMTRITLQFSPTRLLYKRFNLRYAPSRTDSGSGNDNARETAEMVKERNLELVSKDTMNKLMMESQNNVSSIHLGKLPQDQPLPELIKKPIDPERNEVLEAERPGDAVFKAIFGSDDEDGGNFD
ncbi:hypothetical protein CISG_08012 [Coccidioides immitis RMSCC 3703]|uniref:G-patch domain-containing protein n=1 Tax=Coccidioides immitis RMSCC 3703 TaxID=454286 RepID=A0A0J8R8J5_COCIT|nr:hypothetical protein CISG_08012 [Coccidioides immitis RMSCC 3703]